MVRRRRAARGTARSAIGVTGNQALVSAATLWELSIKQSVGKLVVDVDLREHAVEQGVEELPVTGRHALAVRDLPPATTGIRSIGCSSPRPVSTG